MTEHSILAPSSGHIWGSLNGCTGWPLMSAQYPQLEESQDAKDGTASHEIGKELIYEMSRGILNTTFKRFDNGSFTKEMFDCAKIYADDVAEIMRSTGIFGGRNIGIEKRVECKYIHAIIFGTPDAWIYDHKNKRLYIWDYKFGHRIVEIFEMWQLIIYLAGLFDYLKINGIVNQQITVHMRIVQPRAFHSDGIIREWKIKACNLRRYFNILQDRAIEALGPNSVTRSGPHCRDCSARHVCSAALQSGINLYEVASQPIPTELSPLALGVQLSIVKRAIKQLECIESGLTGQVEGSIRNGINTPGWLMQSGRGKEAWTKSTEEVIALGDMLDNDLRKPEETITVNQARIKGISNEVLKEYSERKRTGLKLVPDDGNKLKRLFS